MRNSRNNWPAGADLPRRTRSLSLVARAVNRCVMTEKHRHAAGGAPLSARQVPWLLQCDSGVDDLLVSLNNGLDSDSAGSDAEDEDEDEDVQGFRAKEAQWFALMHKLTQCWHEEDDLYPRRVRRRRSRRRSAYSEDDNSPPTRLSSYASTPELLSEASETEDTCKTPIFRRSSREVLESFVGAIKPWVPRSRTGTEEDGNGSPSHTPERKGTARRLMEQISQDSREVASAASEFVEQVTQDTLHVASAASVLVEHAIARKGTDEQVVSAGLLLVEETNGRLSAEEINGASVNVSGSLERKGTARRIMEQISGETREFASAASGLMEQITQVKQDAIQAANAASGLMEQATAASGALRRKATAEVMRLTSEPNREREDAFWLAPSTHANYVLLHDDVVAQTSQQALHQSSVAKLALKASKKGFKASKKVSSKLWREAPSRREVERMSRRVWQDVPDIGTVSSRLWQEAPDRHAVATISSKLWHEAPGLASIFTGLGNKKQPGMDEDMGVSGSAEQQDLTLWSSGADGAVEEQSPTEDDPAAFEASQCDTADTKLSGQSLQCHMLFASPLCLERLVVVRLSIAFPFTIVAIQGELESWGLHFEKTRPNHVAKVDPGGRVAVWNLQLEHPEAMVRQGDEFMCLSSAGVVEWAQGRPIAHTFKEVLAKLGPQFSAGGVSEMRLELVFRALRALPPLRIHDEISALSDCGCEMITRAATIQNIRALVASAGCRILHMSLHCASEQQQLLFLEDGSGKAHVLRSSELQDLLGCGQQHQHIHIAFLNSCHSLTIGVNFVAAGVRHVVCVRDDDEVRDESCRLFAIHFFRALRAGRSVRYAFDCGKAVLICSQEALLRKDAEAFVLLPPCSSHDEIYFPGGTQPCAPLKPPLEGGSWGAVLPPVEDFLGREVEIHQILRQLHSRRFLTVCGAPGIGKTALLAEVGRFVRLRCEPFTEVRWVDGQDEDLRKACSEGALELRVRLAHNPQHRVLLLVDDASAFAWAPLQALLRFECVSIVVAVTLLEQAQLGDLSLTADLAAADAAATASGLKPVRFLLGPLEPLAQARLFLRRASRPLYTSDLGGAQNSEEPIAPRPSHGELAALAEMPRLRILGGNPRKIIQAAQALPHALEPTQVSSAPNSLPGTPRGLRRVRLVRPDGRARDEWLRGDLRIDEVLRLYKPKTISGAAEIAVMGCRAHDDALLADFPDTGESGLLVLEMRAPEENDW